MKASTQWKVNGALWAVGSVLDAGLFFRGHQNWVPIWLDGLFVLMAAGVYALGKAIETDENER